VTLVLRRPVVFALVVAAYFASAAIVDVLKAIVDRHRPVDHPLVTHLSSPSFPSGHAATSFACAATLAAFVPRSGQIVLYVLAAAIAYSRVYVGVHYPLDVLAGAALGLGVAIALRRLPAVRRRLPQSQPAG
jgi:undecaprenyl-diphosphatase